jgi:CO dehydrogenase maturation factor
MKLAIAGKGGTGKTFIAGSLSRLLARDGYRVLAVDVDPAMNLAYSIGIPLDVAAGVIPITENSKLIEERTGAKPEAMLGGIFSLTPKVDDIADRFGVTGPDGVKLLVMGTVKVGGGGCMCPANALIRALIRHIVLERKDAVIMDMEAGVEHLGRATIRGIDALIVTVEPSAQSIEVAGRIRKLASDIGIRDVLAVANKIATSDDGEFIAQKLKNMNLPLFNRIPFDPAVSRADKLRVAPVDFTPLSPALTSIEELKRKIKERYG